MAYLLRRFQVAYTCGPFSGTSYIWAPNKSTAIVKSRAKRLGIEDLRENPPEDGKQYPVACEGTFTT